MCVMWKIFDSPKNGLSLLRTPTYTEKDLFIMQKCGRERERESERKFDIIKFNKKTSSFCVLWVNFARWKKLAKFIIEMKRLRVKCGKDETTNFNLNLLIFSSLRKKFQFQKRKKCCKNPKNVYLPRNKKTKIKSNWEIKENLVAFVLFF